MGGQMWRVCAVWPAQPASFSPHRPTTIAPHPFYPHPPVSCCAGVCFTRNPATGEKKLYGEYLPNAQGEDVVAGIRTPLDVSHVSWCC